MSACPCQICSGSAGSRRNTILGPRDLHGARVPFSPLCFSETSVCCCSLGKFRRVHHLQGLHTPCSHFYHPQALGVLGMGDTLTQVARRQRLQMELERPRRNGLNVELYQKSCRLGSAFIGSGFCSGVSAEVLKAGWFLGPSWNLGKLNFMDHFLAGAGRGRISHTQSDGRVEH